MHARSVSEKLWAQPPKSLRMKTINIVFLGLVVLYSPMVRHSFNQRNIILTVWRHAISSVDMNIHMNLSDVIFCSLRKNAWGNVLQVNVLVELGKYIFSPTLFIIENFKVYYKLYWCANVFIFLVTYTQVALMVFLFHDGGVKKRQPAHLCVCCHEREKLLLASPPLL